MSGPAQPRSTDCDVDVAVVGFGPVGMALAALLGRAGHRVAVFERFGAIYPLPRAVHLDHEIMRHLQALGMADEFLPEMVSIRDYHWFGADGEPILTLHSHSPAASGWESDYLFMQPALEQTLDRVVRAERTVTVERGWLAEGLVNSSDGAEVTVRRVREESAGELTTTAETKTVRARWLVGADGANSFVREASGIARRDLGFQERWLVVDAEPADMGALPHLPKACQWCDPRRPTTHVQSGPRSRRWEFMLLPGESASEFEDPARVWELLEPWYRPEDGRLARTTVYEFRSMLAERMRDRCVLLAGDAAHLTPPFMGQGLCAGLRDVANIAWKLDLVLRGLAPEDLLDTIERERQPQTETLITIAIELGRVLCQLDPEAAAERDTALRKADAGPALEMPPLTDGVLHRRQDGAADPLAGTLGVQGVVATADRAGLFDDAVGRGFTLVTAGGDPREHLDAGQRELLDALDATVASLDPRAPSGVCDVDGRLAAWLAEHDRHAVLVRPDFYVFGSAASPEEVPALVADLQAQLGVGTPSTTTVGAPL